ncbi:MAG: response regulator [Bacteroidia bacterium]
MDSQNFTFDRVMVVDDTQIDRYIATHTLKKNQFAKECIEFDMATKAIQFLDENSDDHDKLPQLIFLDIRMPEMDGFQFLEQFAKLPPSVNEIHVIMLSSSLDPADHVRAESIDAVKMFINKPLNKINLEEIKALSLVLVLKNN